MPFLILIAIVAAGVALMANNQIAGGLVVLLSFIWVPVLLIGLLVAFVWGIGKWQ